MQKETKKTPGPIIDELAATHKEEFTGRARSYLVSLVERLLNHQILNADIVRGMAVFDPHIWLGKSMEQVTFCLASL